MLTVFNLVVDQNSLTVDLFGVVLNFNFVNSVLEDTFLRKIITRITYTDSNKVMLSRNLV